MLVTASPSASWTPSSRSTGSRSASWSQMARSGSLRAGRAQMDGRSSPRPSWTTSGSSSSR
eukprot:768054-Pyramimonas_sp.AAC.1